MRTSVRDRRSGTFARVRALLVGALVLGVGATATLAAWTDQEYATGALRASIFNTESRTDSGNWAQNSQAPGATLHFEGAALFPGASDYAHIDIRTTNDTTVPGSVQLATSGKSGVLADALQYRTVLVTSHTTCAADAFMGSPTWVAGAIDAYLPTGTVPNTALASSLEADGTQVLRYCFEVQLLAGASNELQGATGTVNWSFVATSTG